MSNPESVEPAWYALHVKPNYEHVVASALDAVQVERYLPLARAKSSLHRDRSPHGTPLLSGYVFAHLDLQRSPRMYSIRGVIRILGIGLSPSPVKPAELDALRAITRSNLPVSTEAHIEPGESIVITEGPFQGIRGSFVRLKNKDCFIVSMPLLRRTVAVVVPRQWVLSSLPSFIPAALSTAG